MRAGTAAHRKDSDLCAVERQKNGQGGDQLDLVHETTRSEALEEKSIEDSIVDEAQEPTS